MLFLDASPFNPSYDPEAVGVDLFDDIFTNSNDDPSHAYCMPFQPDLRLGGFLGQILQQTDSNTLYSSGVLDGAAKAVSTFRSTSRLIVKNNRLLIK